MKKDKGFRPLTTFAKSSITDACQDSRYACVGKYIGNQKQEDEGTGCGGVLTFGTRKCMVCFVNFASKIFECF